AHAGFYKYAPDDNSVSAYECVPVKVTGTHDRNPVYKISVMIDTYKSEMTVVHTLASGAVYDRSEQYVNASFASNNNIYQWTGRWRGKYSVTMRGILAWDARLNGWYYSEIQYDGRQFKFAMVARCHDDPFGD